ncbi:MAG: hypothetical protein KIT80_23495 [Chitinophagaceae bacterium]|nr:hypothetical protein [Nitrosomonas sp.]MCW5929905.1 hypothetical protein [Chitinophagaceae bacterium]
MKNGQSAIERLFEKFAFYYSTKWQSCFKSPAELSSWMDAWAEELDERKVTFDEAKIGLDRCIELYKDWPPTFPQFLEACRPSINYESAFYEAVEQMRKRDEGKDAWTNPAIYWAAVALGGDIMGTVYANVKGRWKAALDKATEEVKTNPMMQEIPKRMTALPAPKRQGREPSEVAKKELAKCYEILNSEPKWKRELKAKGRTIDENIPGLKHVSGFVAEEVETV